MKQPLLSSRQFNTWMALLIMANATCLFNGLLETDGALYAGIAKHIAESNHWLNLYADGGDWLDKPHLPFWITAFSFKVWGINAFAYKLPSFLCYLISIRYCFLLAKQLYDIATAQIAALLLAGSVHMVISNFDGKVEIYLTCFVLAALYHILRAHEKIYWKHLIAAGIFCGAAIITKGIFVLITIFSGVGLYWIITKQWRQFIAVRWYILLVITGLVTVPEIYALYHQFDLHPEKLVFGKTKVSGVRFFFWDSQFGRFFNNGPIKGKGDLSFFLHTTLWAFLPWSFALIATISTAIKKWRNSLTPQHWILSGSALVSFLIFSLSKFQLPHYILVLFPHFAIFTAHWMVQASGQSIRILSYLQRAINLLVPVLLSTLSYYFFMPTPWLLIIGLLITGIAITWISWGSSLQNLLQQGSCIIVLLAVFLNLIFYPPLLNYQAGKAAANWMAQTHPGKPIQPFQTNSYSLRFYGRQNETLAQSADDILRSNKDDTVYLFTHISTTRDTAAGIKHARLLKTFPHYRVSQLSGTFINHATRYQVLDTFAVIQIALKDLLQ